MILKNDTTISTNAITAGLAYSLCLVKIGSELSQFRTHFHQTLLSSPQQSRLVSLVERSERERQTDRQRESMLIMQQTTLMQLQHVSLTWSAKLRSAPSSASFKHTSH